jgi:hypothetical protein
MALPVEWYGRILLPARLLKIGHSARRHLPARYLNREKKTVQRARRKGIQTSAGRYTLAQRSWARGGDCISDREDARTVSTVNRGFGVAARFPPLRAPMRSQRVAAIYAACFSFLAEKVACVIDTVVPIGNSIFLSWALC